MDHAAYHVIYVDSRVSRDLDGKHVEKGESRTGGSNGHNEASWEDRNPECLKSILGEVEEVRINLKRLLTVFNGGMYLIGSMAFQRRMQTALLLSFWPANNHL